MYGSGRVDGVGADCAWYVVDPVRHPFRVWSRAPRRTYAGTAAALQASVFSNGPMVGLRLPVGGKITRTKAAGAAVSSTLGFAALGRQAQRVVAARRRIDRRSGKAAVTAGAGLGAVVAYLNLFTGWVACGSVVSASNRLNERNSFDDEGRRHAWLGRRGVDFDSYRIDAGDAPADLVEGLGGLMLLVWDYEVIDTDPGERSHDLRELGHKRGVVAWGLTPGVAGGVLVILGSASMTALQAARTMQASGVRDAVGMDQRGSVMLGHGRQFTMRRPALHRQTMQTYGLSCT